MRGGRQIHGNGMVSKQDTDARAILRAHDFCLLLSHAFRACTHSHSVSDWSGSMSMPAARLCWARYAQFSLCSTAQSRRWHSREQYRTDLFRQWRKRASLRDWGNQSLPLYLMDVVRHPQTCCILQQQYCII